MGKRWLKHGRRRESGNTEQSEVQICVVVAAALSAARSTRGFSRAVTPTWIFGDGRWELGPAACLQHEEGPFLLLHAEHERDAWHSLVR